MNESPLSKKPEESGVCKSLGITYGEFGKGVAEVHCTVTFTVSLAGFG